MFYGTDFNENRAHVHVGKKGNGMYAKIWLEPEVSVADQGALTDAQIKQVLAIVQEHRAQMLKQWQQFMQGKQVRMIKIKK